MLISIVLIVILLFIGVTLLVLNSQGVTQGITTLTVLSIVVGFVVSVLSLLVAFLQWHHPKAPPASQEILATSRDLSSPVSTREPPQPDHFLSDPQQEHLLMKTPPPSAGQRNQRFDWGEAPHADQLYGRDQELATLSHWLIEDSCRLVAILGMGGIGKTSLTATLVDQIHEHYDYVFWRSLYNALPLKSLLQECLQFVSDQQQTVLPEEVDRQISLLVEYFRARRCLLVLDNVESLLQEGSQAGRYREGYDGYGKLLQRIGESRHQSCVLLTSREKPQEVALLEGEAAATRSLYLDGLNLSDARNILRDKGLQGAEHDWEVLIGHYGGNPLALKLMAQEVHEVFAGQIAAFLKDGERFFGDVRNVLEQQMKRLSLREEEVVYWLAVLREAVPLSDLQEHLVTSVPKGELQEAVRSLRRRHLIEMSANGLFLQPVILEYLTDRLVDHVYEEIKAGQLLLFERHAFLLAQAKAYLRESQCRLIVQPLLQRLLASFSKEPLEQRFQSLLANLRAQHDHRCSYAAGNVLNLLIQLGCSLRGYDFSYLVVRQAYLQGVDLPEVNFAYANLMASMFTDTFNSIICVALSQQGDLLAAGTASGEIRLWHTGSDLPLHTWQGHIDRVWGVAFSPDASILASSSEDRMIRLWEVSSGKLLRTLQGHLNRVGGIAFSPDASLLASGSSDQTVRLWGVSNGECLHNLQGHTRAVFAVAFSSNGSTLASGSHDQTIRLWEIRSGKLLNTLRGHTGWVNSVAFSPDTAILASGDTDQTICLWDTRSGKLLRTLRGHRYWIWSVAFSPDGTILASGSHDRTIRLWEVSSGTCLNTLQGHTDQVWSVTFSPDNRLLFSGGDDQTVRVWEVRSGKMLKTLQGHTQAVRSVAFSPDGSILASGSEDRMIRLWEVSSGKLLKTLRDHAGWVWSVAFSPDGSLLAAGDHNQRVYLWEVSSGKLLRTLQGHLNSVMSIAFSPDSSLLASGGDDQAVHLWEVRSGKLLRTLQGSIGEARSVTFSPDGSILASGSHEKAMCLWEVKSGKLLKIVWGHADWINSVPFSPDGTILASCGDDQIVGLWEVSSGKLLDTLQGHTQAVRSIAFSPDGTILASGSYDQTIKLWEVKDGKLLDTLQGHTQTVYSVAFSLDGKFLASGSYDQTIKLWDLQTNACLRTLRSDRPYERMNITRVKGLTEAQKATLKLLGAIEQE